MNTPTFLVTCSVLLLAAGSIAQAQTAQSTQNVPKVVVGKQLTAKANAPSPGTAAKNPTQKSSVGKGTTLAKASQPSSFWVEDLDVDDDGVVETSDYLYDAQRGMLYGIGQHPDGAVCEREQGRPASGFRVVRGQSQRRTVRSQKGWHLRLQVRCARPGYGVRSRHTQ
jgi:hypothetical protein